MSAGATRKDIGSLKTRKVIGGQTSQKTVNFCHLRRPFTTGREEEKDENEKENFFSSNRPKLREVVCMGVSPYGIKQLY